MPANINLDLLRSSQFIVAGTVSRMGATTMAIDPMVANAGIFKIEEILHGPRMLSGFAGKEITVVFGDRGARPNDRMVLYASSWMYGDSLAVVEVGRTEDKERAAMRKEIDDADHRLTDEKVAERVRMAELVVTGRVEKTELLPHQLPMRSEHDPLWTEALLHPESIEKGMHEGALKILFPASTDIAWSQSPKFHAGQEGIWILHHDQQERGAPRHRVRGLTALDPLDFHEKAERPRIRRFIQKA